MEKIISNEKESKALFEAGVEKNIKKVKYFIKGGKASVDWKNPNSVSIFILFYFHSFIYFY